MRDGANDPDSSADDAADESPARSFATWTAAATSGAIIAQQVAGKAIRDAFYLTNYSVKTLPTVMVVGAIVSLFSALAVSRLLATNSPRRVLPWLFVGSGVGFFSRMGSCARRARTRSYRRVHPQHGGESCSHFYLLGPHQRTLRSLCGQARGRSHRSGRNDWRAIGQSRHMATLVDV